MTKQTDQTALEKRREYHREYKRKLRADPNHVEKQYPDANKNYQRKLKTIITMKAQPDECQKWRDKIQVIADKHGLENFREAVELAIEKEFKRCK